MSIHTKDSSVTTDTTKGLAPPSVEKVGVSRLGHFFASFRRKVECEQITRISPIISTAGAVAAQTASSVSHGLLIRQGTQDSTFPTVSSSNKWVCSLKLIGSGVASLAAIYNIAAQIIEVDAEVKKRRTWEGVGAGLCLGEAVGNLMESVASFAQGLNAVQSSVSAISWVPPVAIAGALLSSLAIPINVLSVIRTKEILKKLEEPEGLEHLKAELQNKEKGDGDFFLQRHFAITNREKYSAQILYIINSNPVQEDSAVPVEKRATAKQELSAALKGRLSSKITSHALAISAAIIGLIGVMLLLFPVLGPIGMICGLALLGVSSSLMLGKHAYDYHATTKLQKKLDKLCDFSKIPDHQLPDFAKPLRPHLIKA